MPKIQGKCRIRDMDEKSKHQNLLPIIQQYGDNCMAYSSLQEGLEYEVVEDIGFIAYLTFKHFFWSRKGVKIVLADPLCDKRHYKKLVMHFIAKYTNVIFVQSSDAFASVLNNLGYEVNQFGIETDLLIQDFDLKGKHRSKLRQWRNKCKREGVEVKECPVKSDVENNPDWADNRAAVEKLSNEWVKKKGGHEFTMLTRPLRYEAELDVRYFQAFKNNELIAFSVFDPMYDEDKVIGYYHNIDRVSQTAPHGTGAFILLQAMDVFRDEGKSLISLGMSPLYSIKRTEYNYNNFLHDALWFAYRNLEFLYPFKGNALHKKKFNGTTKRVFFSSTKGNNLWQLFIALKALKLL